MAATARTEQRARWILGIITRWNKDVPCSERAAFQTLGREYSDAAGKPLISGRRHSEQGR